jgi:hypothetical protein
MGALGAKRAHGRGPDGWGKGRSCPVIGALVYNVGSASGRLDVRTSLVFR